MTLIKIYNLIASLQLSLIKASQAKFPYKSEGAMLFRRMGLNWSQALGIAVASTVGFYGNRSVAQITPDGTLPNNSNVTLEENTRTITGGTERGGNLFHSFREFSVPTGSEAFFNNGANIQNIINRVTGGSISDIDGLIRANGGANLFLINPNGIVFGPNARLNIGGSFYGTSANSMRFSDGSEFSAVNPQSPPLLTINVPLGLQFGNNPGNITVGNDQTEPTADSPTLLEVPTGETLALVGGDVNVNGERLRASGGRIELGGLTSGGTVGINNDGSLTFPDGVARADVFLNRGEVDVTGGEEGSIGINAGNIDLINGSDICAGIGGDINCGGLASDTTGFVGSQAGDITLNATGDITGDEGVRINNRVNPGAIGNSGNINIAARSLSMTDGVELDVSTSGQGNAGGVSITTGSLEFTNGAILRAATFGQGDAGSVTINANDSVKFDGRSGALSTVGPNAVGNAGGVSITTGSLELTNIALLTATTLGQGDAGGVSITTGSLEVTNGAQVSSSTGGQGDAGNVTIKANDLVKFDGSVEDVSNSGAFSTVGSNAVGNAGGVSITTGSLEVTNGAQVNASTRGQGNAGSVTIKANDLVKFDGEDEDGTSSGAFSAVESNAVGNGGGVSITTGSLEATNGAQITASTSGQGNAGSVTINANDLVKFDGEGADGFNSGALSQVGSNAVGNAGGVSITTDSLELTNGAQVSASTFGQGNAGSVTINANGLVKFDGEGADGFNSGAFSQVNSGAVGNGGGLSISTDSLEVTDGARVSASSFGQGNAGDIEIDAKSIGLDNNGTIATDTQSTDGDPQANINIRSRNLILRRGSNINANARGEGVIGGNINIDTGVLAGFEDSDITANSTDARGGNVVINAEGVFGMQFRDQLSPLSDITATGVNNELSGNVEIDTPEADPTRGLGEVEADTVDASNQISDPCVPGGGGFSNSFVSIGRGGLPITPTEPLQDTSTISTWVRLKPQPASRTNQTTTNRKTTNRKTTNRKTTNRTTSSQPTTVAKTPKVEKPTETEKPTQIVEATGWIVNAQGNIEFVAQANHTNPKSPWQNPASCSVSSEN